MTPPRLLLPLLLALTACQAGNPGNDSADGSGDTADDTDGSGDTADDTDDTDGSGDTADDTADDTDGSGDTADGSGEPGGPAPGDLLDTTAAAVCGRLLECCDGTSIERYFSYYRAKAEATESSVYRPFVDRLPPAATVDATSCEPLVRDLLEVGPLQNWLDEVDEGRVGYRPDEALRCLDAIRQAPCGPALLGALQDGGCLSDQAPPYYSDGQVRRVFEPLGQPGDVCAAVIDGQATFFYGTCDPSTSFCCFVNGSGDCSLPSTTRRGECRAARPRGESCLYIPPIQLCELGSECGADDRCTGPASTPLALGAECATVDGSLLGRCEAGWCDYGGPASTRRCEAPRGEGEGCGAGYECATGACGADRRCVAFCAGG
jgi:hypothetical protein